MNSATPHNSESSKLSMNLLVVVIVILLLLSMSKRRKRGGRKKKKKKYRDRQKHYEDLNTKYYFV